MTTKELNLKEFVPYYSRYINKIPVDIELRVGFENGYSSLPNFFNSIPDHKLNYRYGSDKWNPKEILQHLIDTERIFIYRCFRIARHDRTILTAFDQSIYVDPSRASEKPLDKLLKEFIATRYASMVLLNSLTDQDLKCIGSVNGGPMSARAAAFTIIGHNEWHKEIIRKKYLDA